MKKGCNRFVFIGCGKIAFYHADVIVAEGHEIVGVAARPNSKNIGLFSKKYQIKFCYEDFHKMLNELRPDAIILCTSWDQTEDIIVGIISWGIPVLVEKPVALSSEKIRTILKEIGNLSENVLVGYNRRFYDFVPKLKRAISDQNLLSIQLNFPEAVSPIVKQLSPKVLNHILIYMSSHWLDIIMFLVGEVELVVMQKQSKGGYISSYNGLLTTKIRKIPIHYQSNFDAPQQLSISFSFIKSIWELRPLEILSVYEELEIIEPTKEYQIRQYRPKLTKCFKTDLTFKPGFYNQMRYFIKNFLDKKNKNSLGSTLEDALKVTLLCEKIKQGSAF